MSLPDSGRVSLIELAVRNVGLLQAGRSLAYLVTWCWSMERHGPEMRTEDYAADWELGLATAYRHRAAVNAAFDGVDLAEVTAMVADLGGKRRTQRGALRVGKAIAPQLVTVD